MIRRRRSNIIQMLRSVSSGADDCADTTISEVCNASLSKLTYLLGELNNGACKKLVVAKNFLVRWLTDRLLIIIRRKPLSKTAFQAELVKLAGSILLQNDL
jgi:hypothetical protein